MFLTPLLILVTLAFSVQADLSHRMLVPENADRVALDEINKRLIAFDVKGTHLGDYHMKAALPTKRADGDPCESMSATELDNFPGTALAQLNTYVQNYFPTDVKYKILVTDLDLTIEQKEGHRAGICISKGFRLKIDHDNTSKCKHDKVHFPGAPAAERVVMSLESGIYELPSITITEQSAFQTWERLSLTSWPSILTVPWSQPDPINVNTLMDLKFKHTVGEPLVVSNFERYWQTVFLRPDHSPSCKIFIIPQTCDAKGSGELDIYATGWLWFEYEEKVGHTDDNKHWKWAFNMDKIVRQEDRSSPVKFTVSGKMPFRDLFTKEGCSDHDFLNPGIISKKPFSYNPFRAGNVIKVA